MTPPAAFEAPPSEAYLCAIRRMLAESGGGAEPHIPLLRVATAAELAAGSAAVVALGAPWVRPDRLATLRAVLYEAGAAQRPPWELPRRAAEAETALRAAGVDDVAELCAWLRRGAALGAAAGAASPLRAALAAAGHIDALDAAAEAALAAALLAEDDAAAAAAPAESG
jgi:hypothetical protein